MQKNEIRELLALLDKRIEATARAAENAEAIIPGSERSPIADAIRASGSLLVDARDMIADLAIRCGILMPPRTVRLSDLVEGREPFELGAQGQFVLALGNLVAVFREDGAAPNQIAAALRVEADLCDTEAAEDRRKDQ